MLRLGVCSIACGIAVGSVEMKSAEPLDRGVVALPAGGQRVYVGWRALAQDASDAGFDVFRRRVGRGPWGRRNDSPITDSSNFLDLEAGPGTWEYAVSATGRLPGDDDAVRVESKAAAQPYFSIRLQERRVRKRSDWGTSTVTVGWTTW